MENINKPSKEDIIKYEELYEYYIIENHQQKECCIRFGINLYELNKILKEYKIIKHPSRLKEWAPPLSYKQIEEVYLNSVISGKEAAKILGVSFSTFRRCIVYYDLHKDKELVQKSINNAWNQKYQNGHPLRDKKTQKKIKETCKRKYGVDCVFQNKEVKEKIKETLVTKYGVDNPLKSSEIKEKIKKINLFKYGVEHPAQTQIQHYDVWSSYKKLSSWLQSFNKKQNLFNIAQYFNVDYSSAVRKIKIMKLEKLVIWNLPRSHYEDEIVEILHKEFHIINIELNKRGLLPSGKEIDIYLPDYKVGIEFNGEYWHCDLHEKFQDHSGRSHYHQDKSLEAERQGIFLFHIFEHEWDEMWTTKNSKFQNSHENIINRLGNILTQIKNHIPARKCEIREITKAQKKDFLNKNHIQGNEHTGSYALGLFYEDQLVSCMCFGHSKFSRYNYELTRFATIHDAVVQGGASKLFKYFIDKKMNEGEKVVSYNDITKTKGDIYKILGFECVSINEPNYWWVNFDTMDIRSRYQEQEAGEVERMHSQGYHRICDCGTRTWVYTKK